MSNLRSLFNRIPSSDREVRITWYQEAHDLCDCFAGLHDITLEQSVGVMAVISPSISWEQNIRAAQTIIESYRAGYEIYDFTVPGYVANIAKAWAILIKADDVAVESLLGKKAPKVRAFYDNILHPKTSTKVTVDRWMVRAFFNDMSIELVGRHYQTIADEIVLLANEVGVSPQTMQAWLWIQVKKESITQATMSQEINISEG